MGCGDRKSTWLARTPTGTAISDHSPVKRKMSGASHSAPSCPPQRTSQGPQQGWTVPPDLRVLPAAAHQTGSHLCLFDQSLAQTCSFRKRHTCCFSCPPRPPPPSYQQACLLCTGRGCLQPTVGSAFAPCSHSGAAHRGLHQAAHLPGSPAEPSGPRLSL